MSAELYDGELTGPLAQPAVDILPAAPSRKGKQAPPDVEASTALTAPTAMPAPTTPSEFEAAVLSAPAPEQPVNPWTGAPTEPAASYPAPTTLPIDTPPALPVAAAAALAVVPNTSAPEATAEAPKKFFGMQVRRPKKSAEAEVADAPVASAPPAFDAVVAPVAAWPTDVGVPVVADAEPHSAAGGYATPAAFAPIDLLAAAPVSPPVEVVTSTAGIADPFQPPVEAPTMTPVEADQTTPFAPVAPVSEAVAPSAPAPNDAEVSALRALLEASEAQRLAAENRADQAVTYAQQTQSRLQQLESDGQARIQAAEAKSRTAANEAQDWQIRHREAETTISELAASVAGAEQRLSELRAERDDLLASLEDATAPATDTHQVPLR